MNNQGESDSVWKHHKLHDKVEQPLAARSGVEQLSSGVYIPAEMGGEHSRLTNGSRDSGVEQKLVGMLQDLQGL